MLNPARFTLLATLFIVIPAVLFLLTLYTARQASKDPGGVPPKLMGWVLLTGTLLVASIFIFA